MVNPSGVDLTLPHPPSISLLGTPLELGPVELNVADLSSQVAFYSELVGLSILSQSTGIVTLGQGDRSLLRLHHTPHLSPALPGSAGLYHSAFLFASQTTLAQAVDRIFTKDPDRFSGTADHLVSEAFYFQDPEGNGVELYFDRPSDTWEWRQGRVVMGAIYIDPAEYIASHVSERTVDSSICVGHVHLKVGDLAIAREFYEEVLGFSVTAALPSALFVSDGRYHHHLGMNTWESAGAGLRTESLGLRQIEVVVSSEEILAVLQERLRLAGIRWEGSSVSGGIVVTDPWGTRIHFRKA